MHDHADELNLHARVWKATVLAMSSESHLERAATHLANADMCRTALAEEEGKAQPNAGQIQQLRTSEVVFLQRAQIHASLASVPSEHRLGPVAGIPAQLPTPFLA